MKNKFKNNFILNTTLRIVLIIAIFLLGSTKLIAQETENDFDFWVGNWEVSWKNAKGETEKGKNNVNKILNTVIEENFEITGFKGKSLSIYNKVDKKWHQMWVDDSGGYYNLIGEVFEDKRIFKMKYNENVYLRMVFYNIKEDSFTWDWESSEDGGKTWELRWKLNYKRLN